MDTPGAMVKFCPSMSPEDGLTTTCTRLAFEVEREPVDVKPGGGALVVWC